MPTVAIVGGGKAGTRLFELLTRSSVASVQFVVDMRVDAPAVVAAHAAGVPTYTDAARAFAAHKPQVLFEVTGNQQLAAELRELCTQHGSELVVASAAAIVMGAIEESQKSLAEVVVTDVQSIKRQIDSSLGEMRGLLDSIDQITSDMQMLALNARIEAARVGDQGRGFAVVAQEMATSTESIRGTARHLDQLNASIKGVAAGIDQAMLRLA